MSMNKPSALRVLLGSVALLFLVSVAYSDGGDLVTVKDFPDFAVAGKPPLKSTRSSHSSRGSDLKTNQPPLRLRQVA